MRYLLFFIFITISCAKDVYIYQKPIEGELNRDWIISNFVDIDSSVGGYRDYKGGKYTYDNHKGTDFFIRGFVAMDRGVDVYSARDGVIVSIRDGLYDKETTRGKRDSNCVYIRHNDNTKALYAHMKKDSITKLGLKEGDSIKAGTKIGEVGSSGDSTGPHLHFALYDKNNSIIDPASDKYHRFGFDLGYEKNIVVDFGISKKWTKPKSTWNDKPDNLVCIEADYQSNIYLWTTLTHVEKGSNIVIELTPTKLKTKLYTFSWDKKIGYYYRIYKKVKWNKGEHELKVYLDGELKAKSRFFVHDSCK